MIFHNVNFGSPVNWSSQLNSGLVSWWMPLQNNRGGGTLFDLCNRNHGTLTSMDLATAWVPGRQGYGALRFDDTDDYVAIGTQIGLGSLGNVLTVACWLKQDADTRDTIIGRNQANEAWQLEIGTVGSWTWGIIDDDTNIARTTAARTVGSWEHFAYTRSGTGAGTHGLYYNGESQALDVDSSANYNDSSTFQFGRRTSTLQFFGGELQEVRIYDRALSADEINRLYFDSRTGYQRTLRRNPVYYGFNSVAAPAASAHHIHLPLLGAA
jgi:hypothetical protein